MPSPTTSDVVSSRFMSWCREGSARSIKRSQHALRSANGLENDGSRAVVGSGGVGVVLTIAFKLSMLSTPSVIDRRKYLCFLVL